MRSIRSMMLALPCIGLLSLGACTTAGGLDPGVIKQVQDAAVAACSFLPTAQTVAQIIGTFTGTGPIVGGASAIASAICNAITNAPKAARKGAAAAPPMVNGVVIHGRFVR